MPRAPFNTTCDIYQGPGGSSPGAFIGTFSCRLVIADSINVVGPGSLNPVGWLTLDGYQPRGWWVAPPFSVDPTLCDQIAVPSGAAISLFVFFTEEIIHLSQPAYFRATVGSLPLPTPTPGGGTCATAIPASLSTLVTIASMLPGEEIWYVLSLAPGSYTLTTTASAFHLIWNVFEGGCSGLSLILSLGSNTSAGFTVSGSGIVDVHVRVSNLEPTNESCTWIVT